jgi:hypothetical protein
MENRHFSEGLQVKGCQPREFGKVTNRMVADTQTHRRPLVWVIVMKTGMSV